MSDVHDGFKIIGMVAIISGYHLLSHFDKSQVLWQGLISRFHSLTTYAARDLLEVLRLVTWTQFTRNSAHIIQAKQVQMWTSGLIMGGVCPSLDLLHQIHDWM
jgi:hypothetical protein